MPSTAAPPGLLGLPWDVLDLIWESVSDGPDGDITSLFNLTRGVRNDIAEMVPGLNIHCHCRVTDACPHVVAVDMVRVIAEPHCRNGAWLKVEVTWNTDSRVGCKRRIWSVRNLDSPLAKLVRRLAPVHRRLVFVGPQQGYNLLAFLTLHAKMYDASELLSWVATRSDCKIPLIIFDNAGWHPPHWKLADVRFTGCPEVEEWPSRKAYLQGNAGTHYRCAISPWGFEVRPAKPGVRYRQKYHQGFEGLTNLFVVQNYGRRRLITRNDQISGSRNGHLQVFRAGNGTNMFIREFLRMASGVHAFCEMLWCFADQISLHPDAGQLRRSILVSQRREAPTRRFSNYERCKDLKFSWELRKGSARRFWAAWAAGNPVLRDEKTVEADNDIVKWVAGSVRKCYFWS